MSGADTVESLALELLRAEAFYVEGWRERSVEQNRARSVAQTAVCRSVYKRRVELGISAEDLSRAVLRARGIYGVPDRLALCS